MLWLRGRLTPLSRPRNGQNVQISYVAIGGNHQNIYERNPPVSIYNAVVLCEVMRELDASMAETFRMALSYTQCGLLAGGALNGSCGPQFDGGIGR